MADLWLILDVETTGLDPENAGVWQLGAVLWQDGAEVASLETLVRPRAEHWTPEHRALARRISGLTAAEERAVMHFPMVHSLQLTLMRLLALLPAGEVDVVATSYNRAFEQGFLEAEPAALSRRARETGVSLRWGPCLMDAAASALVGLPGHFSLRKACEGLNLPWSGSHRALADARLAAQVGEALGVFTGEEEENAHPQGAP